MLSRRGIRIKVMKILYSVSRDETLNVKMAKSAYDKSVRDTYDLFLMCLYAFIKVTKVSTEDAEKRKSKYLPSEIDKNFAPTLYENSKIQGLEDNKYFRLKIDKLNLPEKISNDMSKNIYYEFLKEESYLNYITGEKTEDAHLQILLELFRFCRKSEFFNDTMEENYISWIDDKSVVVGTIKKILKGDTTAENIFDKHKPDSLIVDDFGKELLDVTFEEDDELLEIIKPILDNWDHERLAILDMIFIKMAIMEFLKFETIPVKVTMNEYVEISKMYSTPKSKEFVNGILDKVLKQLQAEDKIKKAGRGLID